MMSKTNRIRGMARALGTATAVCGAAAVGAAPAAVAGEDPGGVSSCPKGSLATSAVGSYVGVAVPVGAEGPSGAGSAAEAVGKSGTSSEAPMFGELVGRACYQRTGGTATMRFRWSSVGRVQTGTFVYQLLDCTTGHTSASLTRRLDYETPTGTSGHAEATVKVNPAHKYRMRISGGGVYERAADGVFGLVGYWSSVPPQGSPKWQGETTCA
jgi:hypothetical protein